MANIEAARLSEEVRVAAAEARDQEQRERESAFKRAVLPALEQSLTYLLTTNGKVTVQGGVDLLMNRLFASSPEQQPEPPAFQTARQRIAEASIHSKLDQVRVKTIVEALLVAHWPHQAK